MPGSNPHPYRTEEEIEFLVTEPTMMKSSRASPVRSSSIRVRGDSRGAVNIPNFGSYGGKGLTNVMFLGSTINLHI